MADTCARFDSVDDRTVGQVVGEFKVKSPIEDHAKEGHWLDS